MAENEVARNETEIDPPLSYEEAKWFYEGFLVGAGAYADAVGHSQLKSENPTLCRLFDERRQKMLEDIRRTPPMPENLESLVGKWLAINNQKASDVQHGTFPIGFVMGLMPAPLPWHPD